MTNQPETPNKTDAGNGSKTICRVSKVLLPPAGGAFRVVFDKLCPLMRASALTLWAAFGCLPRSTKFVRLSLAVA